MSNKHTASYCPACCQALHSHHADVLFSLVKTPLEALKFLTVLGEMILGHLDWDQGVGIKGWV